MLVEEGDQQRFWKLTRRFADLLIEATGTISVKVVRIFAHLGNNFGHVTCSNYLLPGYKAVRPACKSLLLCSYIQTWEWLPCSRISGLMHNSRLDLSMTGSLSMLMTN